MRKFTLIAFFLFTFITGWSQNALNFDGTSDYIQTTYKGVLGNNPITVEAWVNTTAGDYVITSWGGDIVKGDRFTFRIANTVLRVENKGGAVVGLKNVTDSKWHHIAVTYDPSLSSNKYKLYVDGVLDVEGDIATPLNVTARIDMRIGRRIHTTFTTYYKGTMDELRVWDVVRTQKELFDNKDGELTTLPSSLKAYYKFNQGVAGGSNSTVSTLIDNTTNGNNGTLITFGLTGNTSNWVNGKEFTDEIIINQDINICEGESIVVGSKTYNTSGTYKDTLTSSTNKDSIVNTTLSVNPKYSISNTYEDCEGFTVTVGSKKYGTTGIYYDTLQTVKGCDSIIVTDMTIHASSIETNKNEECEGSSITVGTNTYNTTGIYYDILKASNGCDSIIITDLTVFPSYSEEIKYEECEGFSVTVGLNTYDATGVYIDTLQSVKGCDSVITTDLTIRPISSEETTYNECEGFSVTVNTNIYSETGVYYDTLETVYGCDSIIITNLNINEVDTVVTKDVITLTAAESDSYQWLDCENDYAVIDGETNQTFTPTNNGTYAVELVQNDCKDTSSCFQILNIGIEDNEEGLFFAIYPNPNDGAFTINSNISTKQCALDILSIDGKVVVSLDLTGQNLINLPLVFNNLNSGIYFVQLKTDDKTYANKLIIK